MITRRIGKFIRGSATPFQVMAAAILASLIGFVPGFAQAPGLMAALIGLLIVLNANLFVAGIVGLAAKLVALLAAPVVFQAGRFLLEGPLEGAFRSMVNAPVLAWFGLEYYLVSGGLLVGFVFGLLSGLIIVRMMQGLWRKLATVERDSAAFAAWTSKRWVKATAFVFVGGLKGKKSWDELLARRIGNPVRIAGVVLVLVLAGAAFVGLRVVQGPMLTASIRSGLERANGATVDLERATFEAGAGRLVLSGLALTDPGELSTNLFAAQTVEASVGTGDLLRRRAVIDSIVVSGATNGAARTAPGQLVGPPPDKDGTGFALPDMESLGDILENAPVWRERLATLKRWMEQLSGGTEDEADGLSWEEQLRARVRALGYAGVRHDALVDGAPTLLIRRIEANGVVSSALPGQTLDVHGEHLSTQPRLVKEAPAVSVVSSSGDMKARLALPSGSESVARLEFSMTGLSVDDVAKQLKKDGALPVSGGTLEIAASGTLSTVDSDLPVTLILRDTSVKIGGSGGTMLRELKIPVAVRGPIDSPVVRVDSKALQGALVSAGKDELTRRLGDQLQKKLGGNEGEAGGEGKNESAKDAAAGLLDGFLNKKK